jgi:cell division protein FtsL
MRILFILFSVIIILSACYTLGSYTRESYSNGVDIDRIEERIEKLERENIGLQHDINAIEQKVRFLYVKCKDKGIF